jgi:mono/diheme cytochrome c family protein
MKANLVRGVLAGAIIVAVLAAGIWIGRRAPAENAAPQEQATATATVPRPAEPDPPSLRDPYQRSLAIFEFKKAAQSGVDRGREIFYYKCWFCHNEWADGAPKLTGVYSRKQLLSGRPTTDDGIKDEIRNGGAGMAAYKYVLSEADLDDLVSFIREGCCWNSDAPPPNPHYRGQAEGAGE